MVSHYNNPCVQVISRQESDRAKTKRSERKVKIPQATSDTQKKNNVTWIIPVAFTGTKYAAFTEGAERTIVTNAAALEKYMIGFAEKESVGKCKWRWWSGFKRLTDCGGGNVYKCANGQQKTRGLVVEDGFEA
jgi:hypothetical protein